MKVLLSNEQKSLAPDRRWPRTATRKPTEIPPSPAPQLQSLHRLLWPLQGPAMNLGAGVGEDFDGDLGAGVGGEFSEVS